MKRGEVWLINLDPTIGSEMKKVRPAVIVSSDDVGILPLKVIVPVTDWKPHYREVPWMTHLAPDPSNGLAKPSAADALQVRSVAVERFVRQLGVVKPLALKAITSSLALVLEMSA
jgi:mRNA interferase MazF